MASGHAMRSLQQVRNNFYRQIFSGLYKLYLLKLPAPPCAVLLLVSLGVCIKICFPHDCFAECPRFAQGPLSFLCIRRPRDLLLDALA